MTEKTTRTVRIGSAHGLHARPAKMFVEVAKEAGFPIEVSKGTGRAVSAASILGVIALGANQGDEITLSADSSEPSVETVLDALQVIVQTDHDAE